MTQTPNSYAALVRAIVDATAFASKAKNRKEIAETISPANYLNQPPVVVEQALTGTYADGLGGIRKDPKRVDFDPFPWQSFAVWMLTQMKRWGQIKGDVDYQTIAEQIFLATDTAKLMRDMGFAAPTSTSKTFVIMGKTFDPSKPDDYVQSFSNQTILTDSTCRHRRLAAQEGSRRAYFFRRAAIPRPTINAGRTRAQCSHSRTCRGRAAPKNRAAAPAARCRSGSRGAGCRNSAA